MSNVRRSAQQLKTSVWVRFLGPSNRTESPPQPCFFGAMLFRRSTANMDPVSQYMLQCNTVNIASLFFYILIASCGYPHAIPANHSPAKRHSVVLG